MLLVPTSVRPSSIHGNGLFADEHVGAGTLVWQFVPEFDRVVDGNVVSRWSSTARVHVFRCWAATERGWLEFGDHAGFINHDASPNLTMCSGEIVAACNIPPGEELTLDYSAVDFGGIK